MINIAFVGQLGDNDEEDDISDDDASMEDVEHDGVQGHLPDGENRAAQKELAAVENQVDFEKEAEVARKVLDNLIKASVTGLESQSWKSKITESTDGSVNANNIVSKKSIIPGKKPGLVESMDTKKSEQTAEEFNKGKSDLDRTIFISNLPFDIDNEVVKQRFSVFGEVQAFLPVLHPLTKYVTFILHPFLSHMDEFFLLL